MKRNIVILCTILTLSGHTYAQQKTDAIDKMDYIEKIEKYRRMKATGTGLTIIGSVLVVVGMTTLYSSIDDWDNSTDDKLVVGTFCALAGYASLGAGIPLWIVGAVKHKKYTAQAQGISIKLNATPQSQGLTLTYRF